MTGIVYKDLNDDGIRDAGEPVEPDRTVFIDFDEDGVLDVGEHHTQTDANGKYTFENLPLGEYRVRVVLPAGYGHTPPVMAMRASLTSIAAPLSRPRTLEFRKSRHMTTISP